MRERTLGWMVLMVSCAFTGAALAAQTDQRQMAGDLEVFYGFTSAARIQALPAGSVERAMHGGVPAGKGQYHLTVTIADRTSQQRLADAQVWATVGELGLSAERKKLELIAPGPPSYGQYFRLGGAGRYQIHVEILRQGQTKAMPVDFIFTHKP